MKEAIEIRTLNSIRDLNEVRKLESKIWGESDSIPVHQTVTAVKNGGLVLGAYLNEELIGFQYSFPGFNGKTAYLCSHILGIDQQYRNKGIGEQLKRAQRKEALKLDYSLITWTYDPLESINGYLNIGKLGGVCSTYLPNCYGEMEDLLNSGIPSDRFLVEWQIQKELSADTSEFEYDLDEILTNSVLKYDETKKGLPRVTSASLGPSYIDDNDGVLFVPIPKDFRKIKETDLALAIDWRLQTRTVFTRLFSQGWKINGFKKGNHSEIPVNFYRLTQV